MTDNSVGAGDQRIVLAEDSPTQILHITHILRKHGYEVQATADGKEALAAIHAEHPAMVITDVLMPEMDGYELCATIKGDPELRQIPVILLTTLSDPRDIIRGLECEADAFLTKPVEEEKLISRLQYILVNQHLRAVSSAEMGIQLFFAGKQHFIRSDRIQIIDLLLSSFETAVHRNLELEQRNTELKKAFQTIKTLQASYRAILQSSDDAMIVTDRKGTCLYANPSSAELLGQPTEEFINKPFAHFDPRAGNPEVLIGEGTDSERIAMMTVSPTHWQQRPSLLFSLRDITETVRAREKLRELSLTDELTGVLNRRGFTTLASQQLKVSDRSKRPMSLVFIDMDGLKWINDTWGHTVGDEALVALASSLRHTFRAPDLVARLSGDEFAVLALDTEAEHANRLAERLLEGLIPVNESSERRYTLSVSVGVACYNPESPRTISDLLTEADKLMYETKKMKYEDGTTSAELAVGANLAATTSLDPEDP